MAKKKDVNKLIEDLKNEIESSNERNLMYQDFFSTFPIPGTQVNGNVPYYSNFTQEDYANRYKSIEGIVKKAFDQEIAQSQSTNNLSTKIARMGETLITIGQEEKSREILLLKKGISSIEEKIKNNKQGTPNIQKILTQITNIKNKLEHNDNIDYRELNSAFNVLMQNLEAYTARLQQLTRAQHSGKLINSADGKERVIIDTVFDQFSRLGDLEKSLFGFLKKQSQNTDESAIDENIGIAAREALFALLHKEGEKFITLKKIDLQIAILSILTARQQQEILSVQKKVLEYKNLKESICKTMKNLYKLYANDEKKQEQLNKFLPPLDEIQNWGGGIEELDALSQQIFDKKGNIQLEAYSENFPLFFHDNIIKAVHVGPKNTGNDAVYVLNFSAPPDSKTLTALDIYETAILDAHDRFLTARQNSQTYAQGLKDWQLEQMQAHNALADSLSSKMRQNLFVVQVSDKYYEEIDTGKIKGMFQGRGLTGLGAIDTLQYISDGNFDTLLPTLKLIMVNTAAYQPFHSNDQQNIYREYLQTIFTTVAARFMFDDFYSDILQQAENKIIQLNKQLNQIHLYIINGIYFSSGELLEATGNALKEAAQHNLFLQLQNTTGVIKATIAPGNRYSYYQLSQYIEYETKNSNRTIDNLRFPESYQNKLIEEARTHSKIQIVFFSGFAKIIENLYNFSFNDLIERVRKHKK